MRSHRGIFWYSLGLTLLLLLPMVLTVAFFADQYQKQQLLRQASAADSTLRIEPGAQGVYRLLLIVQQEEPAFVLARADGPKQAVTLCALPGSLLVNAPAGTTTLSECALSAGAGRAAQLLCGTVATGETAAPELHYIAATPATWAACAGKNAAVRFDTAALLTPAARERLGYGDDPVAACTAAQAGELIIMSYFFRKIAFNTGLENEGLYIFLPTFLEDLRDNYDNKDPEFDEILRMIKTCRLLIIDDIGAERVTDWVRERMVSIINTRVSNNLTTIYTSNLSPEELRSELGDRIASRVLGSSQVVEITSGDRRGL